MSAAFQVAVAKSRLKDTKELDLNAMKDAKTYRSKMSFSQRMSCGTFRYIFDTVCSRKLAPSMPRSWPETVQIEAERPRPDLTTNARREKYSYFVAAL